MKLNLDKLYRIAAILILALEAVQIVFEGEKTGLDVGVFLEALVFLFIAHTVYSDSFKIKK